MSNKEIDPDVIEGAAIAIKRLAIIENRIPDNEMALWLLECIDAVTNLLVEYIRK